MINCLIVDDEQHAIDILVHYVSQTPFLHLAASTTNPIDALRIVNTQKIDLIFLDIQMPELTGIDFIKAIQGKQLKLVEYLLKPVRFPRFLQAVQKVADANAETEELGTTEMEDDYIFVKTESKGKLLKITLAEIDYIEGMKNYVAIFCGGKKTLVYTSMKELEERLPHKRFIRVHKSFIIPIAKITGIEGNLLRLKNVTAEVQIGESYKNDLMEIIRNKMIQ